MSNEPRKLTPTEINVVLDRLFSKKRRKLVQANLETVWIQPDMINMTAHATLNIELDDMQELAEARDRAEKEILEETKKNLGKSGKSS